MEASTSTAHDALKRRLRVENASATVTSLVPIASKHYATLVTSAVGQGSDAPTRSRPTSRWLVVISAMTLLANACSSEDGTEGEAGRQTYPQVETNEGRLCFRQNGENLEVRVVRNGCLSSSCSTGRESSCSVETANGNISITSQFAFTLESDRMVPCTTDCVRLTAECRTSTPANGRYDVTFGATSIDLELPLGESTPMGEPLDGYQCITSDSG